MSTEAAPTTWRERFEALVAELRAHPDLIVVTAEVLAPPSDELLAQAAADGLPAELLEVYRETDGLSLEWEHRDPAWRDFGVYGAVRLRPLEEVLEADDAWSPLDWPDEVGEFYAGLSEDGTIDWVDDAPAHGRPMTDSWREYLEALLEARAYSGWQEAFLYQTVEAYRDHTVKRDRERMRAVMEHLFPDYRPERVGRAHLIPRADLSPLLGTPIILYRLTECPEGLLERFPLRSDSPLWGCLFWVAHEPKVLDGLQQAHPERSLPDESLGLEIARAVGLALQGTWWLAARLCPEVAGGWRMYGVDVTVGYHAGGDPEALTSWFEEEGARPLPLEELTSRIALVSVLNRDGAPAEEIALRSLTVNAHLRRKLRPCTPGVFALDADDEALARFELSTPEGTAEVERGELRAGHLVTVQIP